MKQKILHPQIILKISLLFWLLLFGSINIYPSNLFRIETLHDFFKAFRILAPAIVGTIIIIILLTKIFYDKEKTYISSYIYIFFTIFFFQLIGSFSTNRINFETLYVIFFSFLSIMLFALLEYLKMQQSYKYFLYSLIIFILISVVILFGLKIDSFLVGLKSFNLYNVFHPDSELAGHAPPRSTGFSRMLAILAVFMLTFVEKKKYPLINPYNFILFFLVILIWLFQSRGSILCYSVSAIFIVLFLNSNCTFFKRLFKTFFYICLPILICIIFSNITNYYHLATKGQNQLNNSNNNISSSETGSSNSSSSIGSGGSGSIFTNNVKNNRIITKTTSSGRIELWTISINSYEKKNFFGYGPQADRIILTNYYLKVLGNSNPYGNNVSNGFIYTFLSGGYFSALLFVIVYILNIFLIIKITKSFSKKESISTHLALVYVIFFSTRSLFENSYAIWGVDYMFLFVSMSILNYQYSLKK